MEKVKIPLPPPRLAERKQIKIRIGFASPSGAGKTVSALLLAYGMTGDWRKICVIDTEHNSAELYSNVTLPSLDINGEPVQIGQFMTLPLPPPAFTDNFDIDYPAKYIAAMAAVEADENIEVVIIDSITPEWDGYRGILEIVDNVGANQGWRIGSPKHDAFKAAVLNSRCHVITTVRQKTEYGMREGENKQGQRVTSYAKMGTKSITREGWEFEVDINFVIDATNHRARPDKDRTNLFEGRVPVEGFVVTPDTGRKIKEWIDSGVDPTLLTEEERTRLKEAIKLLPLEKAAVKGFMKRADDLKTKKEAAEFYKSLGGGLADTPKNI